MKKVTLFIDDEYANVISVTAIGTGQNTQGIITNVTVHAKQISNGDVIYLPKDMGLNVGVKE